MSKNIFNFELGQQNIPDNMTEHECEDVAETMREVDYIKSTDIEDRDDGGLYVVCSTKAELLKLFFSVRGQFSLGILDSDFVPYWDGVKFHSAGNSFHSELRLASRRATGKVIEEIGIPFTIEHTIGDINAMSQEYLMGNLAEFPKKFRSTAETVEQAVQNLKADQKPWLAGTSAAIEIPHH